MISKSDLNNNIVCVVLLISHVRNSHVIHLSSYKFASNCGPFLLIILIDINPIFLYQKTQKCTLDYNTTNRPLFKKTFRIFHTPNKGITIRNNIRTINRIKIYTPNCGIAICRISRICGIINNVCSK